MRASIGAMSQSTIGIPQINPHAGTAWRTRRPAPGADDRRRKNNAEDDDRKPDPDTPSQDPGHLVDVIA